VVVCEHNTRDRERILALLESQGYCRKFPELSQTDDWFVRSDSSASALRARGVTS